MMLESVINLFFFLMDPFFHIKKKYIHETKKNVHNKLDNVIFIILLFFSFASILFFLVVDLKKDFCYNWFVYRMILSLALILLAFLYKKNQQRKIAKLFLIVIVCVLLPSGELIKTFILNGSSRAIWMTYPAAIVLCFSGISFLGQFIILLFTSLVLSPYWINVYSVTEIYADYIFLTILFMVSNYVIMLMASNKQSELESLELKQKSIEQQIMFNDLISTLISPVLVKRLNELRLKGVELHEAIDDLMKIKYKDVVVFNSDFRDYSIRSDHKEFITNELIPSSTNILNFFEANGGIGRQVGDNVMVYFDSEDHEESVLKSLYSAVETCIVEFLRIREIRKKKQERFFILTAGQAYVGNLGSMYHKEHSIAGKPANLGARIDDITKIDSIAFHLHEIPTLIISQGYYQVLRKIIKLNVTKISLEEKGISLKSYVDEKYVYLIHLEKKNLDVLNNLFVLNGLEKVERIV